MSSEDYRRECEARSWLSMGYDTPAKVDELMLRIARHRGEASAEKLRIEMRKQWGLQRGARA